MKKKRISRLQSQEDLIAVISSPEKVYTSDVTEEIWKPDELPPSDSEALQNTLPKKNKKRRFK